VVSNNTNKYNIAFGWCWFCFFFSTKQSQQHIKAFNIEFTGSICFGSLGIKKNIYISLKNIQFNFQEASLIILFFQH